jgi:hypothetical protein
MMSSMVWARLVLSLATLHSVAVAGEWSIVLELHCNCLSACLTGIDCAAYPHILHAHDGPNVRHLGNLHTCVGNM